MMRAGRDYLTRGQPRIVRRINGQSTTGHDDLYIDTDGRAWRGVSDAEAGYLRSSGTTVAPVIAVVRNGRVG